MKKSSPECIGFIMDGNRRWAKEKNIETIAGHQAGFEKFKEVIEWALEAEIPHLIFYAFSSENWNRYKEEVSGLMKLFLVAGRELNLATDNDIRIKIIGDRSRFSDEIQSLIEKLETKTTTNQKMTVTVALSYGGRAEIMQAANRAIEVGEELESEVDFEKYLWTHGLPDPDIIVRTGDQVRLSNFLPWQSVYSELYFTKTLWPDFGRKEFDQVLEDFATRQRRLGT